MKFNKDNSIFILSEILKNNSIYNIRNNNDHVKNIENEIEYIKYLSKYIAERVENIGYEILSIKRNNENKERIVFLQKQLQTLVNMSKYTSKRFNDLKNEYFLNKNVI